MRKIQILGTGCPKCQQLAAAAERAATAAGGEFVIEKVTKIDDILKFGVMVTPALVVDGEVKSAGRVPEPAQLAEMLR